MLQNCGFPNLLYFISSLLFLCAPSSRFKNQTYEKNYRQLLYFVDNLHSSETTFKPSQNLRWFVTGPLLCLGQKQPDHPELYLPAHRFSHADENMGKLQLLHFSNETVCLGHKSGK